MIAEAEVAIRDLAGALRHLLADCDRRERMYGGAAVGVSTDARNRANAALAMAKATVPSC